LCSLHALLQNVLSVSVEKGRDGIAEGQALVHWMMFSIVNQRVENHNVEIAFNLLSKRMQLVSLSISTVVE
jgi:hypothetical protein